MGKPSDKNDKTQLLSDSMVLEVKPKEDKNDRSVWRGLVVGADEFAPPAPAKSSRARWVVLIAVVLAGAGAAAYWLLGRGSDKAAPLPDATVAPLVVPPPPADAPPQDAAPDAPPDAAEVIPDASPVDAAVAAPVDAGVTPTKPKPFLTKRPKKKPVLQYKKPVKKHP